MNFKQLSEKPVGIGILLGCFLSPSSSLVCHCLLGVSEVIIMESDLLGVGVIDLKVEVTLFGFGIWRLSCMSLSMCDYNSLRILSLF